MFLFKDMGSDKTIATKFWTVCFLLTGIAGYLDCIHEIFFEPVR